jgi:hypothetical protein
LRQRLVGLRFLRKCLVKQLGGILVPCAGSALSEAYRPVCQVHLDFEPACKSPQDEEELSGLPLVNVVRSAVCGDIEHFDGWCRVLLIEMLHGVSPPAVDANEIA